MWVEYMCRLALKFNQNEWYIVCSRFEKDLFVLAIHPLIRFVACNVIRASMRQNCHTVQTRLATINLLKFWHKHKAGDWVWYTRGSSLMMSMNRWGDSIYISDLRSHSPYNASFVITQPGLFLVSHKGSIFYVDFDLTEPWALNYTLLAINPGSFRWFWAWFFFPVFWAGFKFC